MNERLNMVLCHDISFCTSTYDEITSKVDCKDVPALKCELKGSLVINHECQTVVGAVFITVGSITEIGITYCLPAHF